MMERKRIVYRFAALVLCLFGVVVTAQSAVTLVIAHPDGTSIRVELRTSPKALFTADSAFVVSRTISLGFVASEVGKCTYENVVTDISVAMPSEQFRMSGDLLIFDATVKASSVRLFTAGGTALSMELDDTGNGLSLSLSSLSPGVYLCRVGNQTFKISKP